MKIFKLMAIALVAMLGFSACEKDCDHDFIEVNHSKDLVGTWTCLEAENEFSEALVIKADGSVVSIGSENGKFWNAISGNIKTVNNKMTMTFEDGDNYEGRFEMICGEAFTIFDENGDHLTYRYCANDLSDEVLGMWVCNDGGLPGVENDMLIMTFSENGKMTMTTPGSAFIPFDYVKEEVDYVVVGDLLFKNFYGENPAEGYIRCQPSRLIYSPNATTLNDMLIENIHAPYQNGTLELNVSYLRVKQTLDLPGMKYDYMKTFVTNVKGLDKDIDFMGYTFNFAKMDGVKLDKMLKTLLFTVEFPDANTIKYSCHYNNQPMSMEAPIAVDGNKMTVKMSEKNPAYKDVDLYTFQDKDNTQMHMYMHSTGFVNFFGNMQVTIMEQLGQLDTTDAAAVKAVFDNIDEAVETINLSIVMTKAK